MPEQNPLDPLFEEIAKLLEFVQKSRLNPEGEPLPPDLWDRLNLLSRQVELLTSVTQDTLKNEGVREDELMRAIQNPESLPDHNRRLVQKAKKLKEDAQKQHQEITKKAKAAKAVAKKYGKSLDQKQMAMKRKGKFKGVGGSNWLPL